MTPTGSRCFVLIEDEALGERLSGRRHVQAIDECIARAVQLPVGDWTPAGIEGQMTYGIGLLVLRGLLARRVELDGRFGAELLGAGDLLRPWQDEDLQSTLPHVGGWRILQECRVAILDGSFARRVAPYPEVTSALFARAVRRARQLAVAMAIMHQPRVEVRLELLLWELADRWGTVHRDGVHVPVRLTHAMLAELIGARRPTVSKAVSELGEEGRLRWTGEHWLLAGDPPSPWEPPATASATLARNASAVQE
ncbi:MAG TPA: Crp/Fnr family transcriptional regulator [Solirubrobacteraceae bacterium]|nr:Crp/Fnr family transcriptional regulator [Solirubrobacteraceae bacterium]